MNLYFISGLGADRSVFQKLQIAPQHTIHHIDWIPYFYGESLGDYARRLSAAIDTTQPFSIIGLSLGGMIASEMTAFLRPSVTILLSSAPTASQLPPWFRTMGKLRVDRLVPSSVYQWCNPFTYWLFGIRTKEEKDLYRTIVRSADPVFVRNAIRAVLSWSRTERSGGIIHLHGNRDRLLPLRYARPDVVIRGGGHLAVFAKAVEVSAMINDILSRT